MNQKMFLFTVLLMVALVLGASNAAAQEGESSGSQEMNTPLGAGFTYQGRLTDGGAAATGAYDFRFRLYDAAAGGVQIGTSLLKGDIQVNDGYFSVVLNFGAAAFNGQGRWLQVAVRPGSSTGAYTVLSPRQSLTAAPYAWYSTKAPWSGLAGVPAGFADGIDADSGGDITSVTASTGLSGGGTSGSISLSANPAYLQRRVSSTCAAGSAIRVINQDGTVTCQSASGSGWSLTGNAGTVAGTNFLGTTDNEPLELHVNGNRMLRLDQNGNVLLGSECNIAGPSALFATIGGGGHCSDINEVDGQSATIAGGEDNAALALFATIGGGDANLVTGSAATIAGGLANWATGEYSFVGGGWGNTAAGPSSIVPGGDGNTANAAYSLAAGRQASADHTGSFVWADASDGVYSSLWDNEFAVQASGGARFNVNNSWYGMQVNNAGTGDGIRSYANTSVGVNWAALYAINSGTSPSIYADSAGTYSGYFEDDIYVAGNCVGCTMVQVGSNAGDELLEAGDLVVIGGLGDPLPGTHHPILHVRRATGNQPEGLVGVVQGKAVIVESTRDDVTRQGAEKAEGLAAPGEYLFIVVQGITFVKVDASNSPITTGQRLAAASNPGYARPLVTTKVNGVSVVEGAPIIGIALAPLDSGTGLIPVLVTLR